MRAVSAGMGPMAWGYIVMLLLLLSARRFRFPVSYHFYFYFHSPAESKGPPNPTSSSLAPTDRSASCLTSRLRLMRIGRPQGRPVTLSYRVRAGLAPALGTVSYHSHYARNFVSWQHIIIKGCGLYLK